MIGFLTAYQHQLMADVQAEDGRALMADVQAEVGRALMADVQAEDGVLCLWMI